MHQIVEVLARDPRERSRHIRVELLADSDPRAPLAPSALLRLELRVTAPADLHGHGYLCTDSLTACADLVEVGDGLLPAGPGWLAVRSGRGPGAQRASVTLRIRDDAAPLLHPRLMAAVSASDGTEQRSAILTGLGFAVRDDRAPDCRLLVPPGFYGTLDLGWATALDGRSLTFTEPGHGRIQYGGSAFVCYVPDSGFQGYDHFEYTIREHGRPDARGRVTVLVGDVSRTPGLLDPPHPHRDEGRTARQPWRDCAYTGELPWPQAVEGLPAPVLTSPLPGARTSPRPRIAGTAEPGTARVALEADGETYTTVGVSRTGRWWANAAREWTPGPHTVTAVGRGDVGRSVPATVAFEVAPGITAPHPPALTGPRPVIAGVTRPDATRMVLTRDGVAVGEVSVGARGEWEYVPPADLPPGRHEFTATARYADGTADPLTVTIDSAARPPAPAVTAPRPGERLDGPVRIAGTLCDIANRVRVTVDSTFYCEVSVGRDGRWWHNPTELWPAGQHVITTVALGPGGESEPVETVCVVESPVP